MAQLPNLDNAPLNLSLLREQSKKELLHILDTIRGKKMLVLDPKLSGTLSLVIQTSVLKEHGIENMRHLSAEPIQTECKNVLYLVRPQVNFMKLIASHIQQDTKQNIQREYIVVFVPRRTVVCEKVLAEEKVHDMVTIGEYPLYMVPTDEDILSFELELSYKECCVDGDTSSLWHVAKALYKLQSSFGVIPNVRAKGKSAVNVADILNRMQQEQPIVSNNGGSSEINTLILLDRHVDMVTPMCTQLTYEGLLDEFVHINNGAVEVDASIMDPKQTDRKLKIALNSSDKLFREIRDLNFGVVPQILRQKAIMMKQDYTDMTMTNQTVSELKDFVKRLNSLPEMTRHTNLAQHLSSFTEKATFLSRLSIEQTLVEGQSYDVCFDYIEEMIHKQDPFITVLRLLVILSITYNGLPKKHFDYLRREILHSYGFEHMATLINLEKAGLIKRQESRSNWQPIRQKLNLVMEDVDDSNPNDIAYVYSGYAPLSIRLVQHALRGGWRSIEEILRLLPGPHSEYKQDRVIEGAIVENRQEVSQSIENGVAGGRRLLVLVVFIGGITFAEISALRFLSAQEGMTYDLIVGTTKIVNGASLLDTLVENTA